MLFLNCQWMFSSKKILRQGTIKKCFIDLCPNFYGFWEISRYNSRVMMAENYHPGNI